MEIKEQLKESLEHSKALLDNLTYSAKVEADCSNEAIEELITHTDKVAEIHNL